MATGSDVTTVKIPIELYERIKRISRFVGDGTVQNYIAKSLTLLMEREEETLRPLLEHWEQIERSRDT